MISVEQWRGSIGCYHNLSRGRYAGLFSCGRSRGTNVGCCVVLVVVMLLLSRCGDVEINPGPTYMDGMGLKLVHIHKRFVLLSILHKGP